MFRFLGSSKSLAHQEERVNTSKIASEASKNSASGVSASSHGPTSRPRVLQQQQQQQQQHNSENMVTLHARLLQEAEKIRKWKVQTELDLKEKEKKMAEASLRIETMKKSILELQLQNEKTSAKLEEEIGNKGEVIKRIDATREMCNLLKSHASNVIDRLTRCETEKTELKYTNKEHSQQFQELTSMFKNLQIQSVENEQKSKSQADADKLEQSQRLGALKGNLEDCEEKIQHLIESLEQKNKEIGHLQAKLEKKVTRVETLETSTATLEKEVTCMSKELETREGELRESALRNAHVQDEKDSLEKKLQELEVNYNSLQTSKDNLSLQMTESTTKLEQKLQSSVDDATMLKTVLEEKQQLLSTCETELAETKDAIEKLKSAIDELLMEKKQAEMNEDMLKYQINNLLAEKEENKGELHNLNGEMAVLQKKLDRESLCKSQAQAEAEELQGKVEAMVLERPDNAEHLKSITSDLAEAQTKAGSLQTLLIEKEEIITKAQDQLKDLEKTCDLQRDQIEKLTAQIQDQGQEFVSRDKALEEKEAILVSTLESIEALKLEKRAVEENLDLCQKEKEELRCKLTDHEGRIQELTSELSEVAEQQKESGKNLTTHQKKAAATAKANKDLEKEVKTLKTKLEKEVKVCQKRSDELDAVHSEMDALRKAQEETETSMEKCKEEMKQVQEQCEQDQKAAKLAMKKAEDMQQMAEKEKENAKALTECQLSEMMSTLETYTQNNEKLISEKDAEIESLKSQVQSKKRVDTKHSEEKAEWNQNLEALKKQINSHEAEKEELVSKMATTSLERDQLNEKVAVLENQLASLRLQATQKSQENQHTPLLKSAGHQSPPVVQVTPQQQAPRTPVPVTPKISTAPKTPSRSILRIANSETKRRKVAFASNNSPSSSEESDLMEIDPEAALCNKKGTPLLFTPTPKLERSGMMSAKSATPGAVPLNRKPRGPPVKQAKPAENDTLAQEMSARSPFFRGKPLEHLSQSQVKAAVTAKTPKIRKAPLKKTEPSTPDSLPESRLTECPRTANVRKTPAKKSKFFSTSPRNKPALNASKAKEKPKETSQMAWFDLDSVYGFGPED